MLCDCLKEYPDGPRLYTHNIRPGFYDRTALERDHFPHLLIMENVEYPATISNCLLLFRRELVEGIRYLTGVRYSEDLLFGAQLLYLANSFCYLKGQALYHYRMNPSSATHRFVPDKWNDYRKLHAGIRTAFGNCADFDFSGQIDLCLLFFLYNSVGDILRINQLPRKEKVKMIHSILKTETVVDMFSHLKIGCLLINRKQKMITWLYKKRLAIGLLCKYYERG